MIYKLNTILGYNKNIYYNLKTIIDVFFLYFNKLKHSIYMDISNEISYKKFYYIFIKKLILICHNLLKIHL